MSRTTMARCATTMALGALLVLGGTAHHCPRFASPWGHCGAHSPYAADVAWWLDDHTNLADWAEAHATD